MDRAKRMEIERVILILVLLATLVYLIFNLVSYTKCGMALKEFVKGNATLCQTCGTLKDAGILKYPG